MKKLKTVGFILAMIILSIIIVLLWPTTITKKATMIVNDEKKEVQVSIRCKIINLITGNLSDDILDAKVVVKSSDNEFRYVMQGKPLFVACDIKRNGLVGFFGEKQYEHGMFYYDKEIKNIVFISKEKMFYAATDEFLNYIHSIRKERAEE